MAFKASGLSMQHYGPDLGGKVYYTPVDADATNTLKGADYWAVTAAAGSDEWFEQDRALKSLRAFIRERQRTTGANGGVMFDALTGASPGVRLSSVIYIDPADDKIKVK